jgi:hypothetical protein
VSDLISILRALVRDELRSLQLGELAVVARAYPHAEGDAHNHECDVHLRESGLELKRVPLATPHVGMASAPAPGDLVYVSYVAGDPNRPIVLGRLYSATASPPVHAAGELHVTSGPGGETAIVIAADESVIVRAGETTITVAKGGSITIAGKKDLTIGVEGDVKLTCKDCTIDASGAIALGSGGGGVITTESHRCYFTGAALVGSASVKAKG